VGIILKLSHYAPQCDLRNAATLVWVSERPVARAGTVGIPGIAGDGGVEDGRRRWRGHCGILEVQKVLLNIISERE
jgi:hypothetical protein